MMSTPDTTQRVADGIYLVDTGFQDTREAVAAYVVTSGDGLALIETGPTTVQQQLIDGIAEAGPDVADLTHVIVTHIHLDHSGGLGALAQRNSGFEAFVHPVGQPHLVEPERLLKSASRIYGDRMDELWGDVMEVPEERLAVLEDRTSVDIGGRSLTPYFTAGHASHHVALLDDQTGSLFTGDVAGARMPGTSVVVPPLPPPDIDLDAWRDSIELMRTLAPERLVLTHFGAFEDVTAHLDTLSANLERVMVIGRDVLLAGGTDDQLTERLEEWVRAELGNDADRVWDSLSAANPMFMTSMGIRRILRKSGELAD